MTPVERRPRWALVGLLAAGHLANDFFAVFVAPMAKFLAAPLGLTAVGVTLLGSVMAVAGSITQPLSGWIGDRIGRQRAIVLGLAASAVFMGLLSQAQSLWMAALCIVLGGFGVSVFHPSGGMATREVSGDRAGLIMALYVNAGSLGVFLGPVFVTHGTAATERQWMLPWSMAPGLAVAALLALAPMRGAGGRVVRREPVDPPAAPPRPVGLAGLLAGLRRFSAGFGPLRHSLYLLVLVTTLRALAFSAFTYLLLLHGQAHQWSDKTGGRLLGAFLGCAAAGGILGGLLADRLGRRRVIVWSCLVGGAVLVLAPQASAGAAAVWLVLGSFCFGAATPVAVVMSQELSPERAATATGLIAGFAWGVGGLILPAVGAVCEQFGSVSALRLGAVVGVAAGVLALFLREPSHRPHPPVEDKPV
jgi:FSR family fosmidomycin resistance protein-like MFS transporter